MAFAASAAFGAYSETGGIGEKMGIQAFEASVACRACVVCLGIVASEMGTKAAGPAATSLLVRRAGSSIWATVMLATVVS